MIIFKRHELFPLIEPHLSANPLIIEAGAYDGTDTRLLAQSWQNCSPTVHAFEPVPDIFTRLIKNSNEHSNIICHQKALSNSCGTAHFFVSEKATKPGIASQAGSLLKPYQRLAHSPLIFPRTITVETIDLPTFMKAHSLDVIDLLWLDTQGMEYHILLAASSFLQKIRVIYTEVGFYENYAQQMTYTSFYSWITAQGFTVIGRDFIDNNRSFFGNIICVRSDLVKNR